ncbi:MAG: hypothetical protein KAS32_25070 [Candidatus Peribacteraceae bacterium]|nr:hypothetical protein [Candidatus Peribacteraceae bacterium]
MSKLKITGQLTGMKNLKIEGGWRVTIDLFESEIVDILQVTTLVNERKTVKLTVEPVET